ncbi:MAG TPA: hypothetical protein VNH44_01685 [Micropepsaceae bacterium]|nr:hypothetical protein [Micropepsaceae bacterium]
MANFSEFMAPLSSSAAHHASRGFAPRQFMYSQKLRVRRLAPGAALFADVAFKRSSDNGLYSV